MSWTAGSPLVMNSETSNDSSHAFSRVSSNDHSGQLWIVTILSLIYSLLGAMVRVYIKHEMFGFDDLLLGLATILHVAQSTAVFVGLNSGLGKFNSITSPEQWAASSRSTLAAIILCLLALSVAKCSVLALILRILDYKSGKTRPFCIGVMVLSAAWGAGSCLALLLNCRATSLLTVNNIKECPSQVMRWTVIAAIDILTEVFTWLLIVRLSWTVNMSLNHKLQVATAFSFRLPLIALSAIHMAYFSEYPASTEPQFAVISSLLYQQTMIGWSLIAATVPNMKNFLKSFSMGLGFSWAFESSDYESSNAYPLRSLQSSRSIHSPLPAAGASTSVWVHDKHDREPRGQPNNWRPDWISEQAAAKGHRRNRSFRGNMSDKEESSRTGSQEMIIIKEVTHGNHPYASASSI
ncbi:hypothetical protein J3F83DRAFT_753312 [Trichoderma novae-zelandiae]